MRLFGGHGRSLRDERYKLIRRQLTAGSDGTPEDTPPTYAEEFYDLLLHPDESDDLVPTFPLPAEPCTTPECFAFRALQTRMTELSGF